MDGSCPEDRPSVGRGPSDLLAALRRRCAVEGLQPWLFFREGWSWRWWSWQQALDRLELDLAGGHRSPPEDAASAEAEALLLQLAKEIDRWAPRLLAELWQKSAVLEGRLAESVSASGLGERWRRRRRQRVAVDSPLADPLSGHVARAWSVATGAALVLPAGAEDWGRSILWSRPTELWVSGEQLQWLASRLGPDRSRPQGLRRLRAVVVDGSPATNGAQLARECLARRGIAVVSFPRSKGHSLQASSAAQLEADAD